MEGSYGFSGTLRDYDRNDHAVGGASTLTVSSGDPLIARYDANNNGMIDKSEVIVAINDYLFGEGEPITKAEVIKLINLYLFGPSAAQPPGAPTGLTATANGQTRIDLSWRAPSDDGGAAITGYRIEVSPDGSNWTNLVADAGSTSISYTHTGLTAGSTRHYRVSAINSAGTGPVSNTATVATAAAGAPGAPTGLTATANGQTRIDLSWRAPSNNGVAAITGYKIEVSENGSSWSDLETNTGSTSTSYTHTGLTAGSTRHYRVSAINSAGTGLASNTANATTDSQQDTNACASEGAVSDAANNPGLVSDCETLLTAKDSLRGTESLNWSPDTSITVWNGVVVSGTPPRVTSLSLASSGLTGQIPAELGDLTKLTELSLHLNELSGGIPAELGKLTDLTVLRINNNKLNGPIPAELGNLTNLTTLWLSVNRLGGGIPTALGNVTKLTTLRLNFNQLSGEIPAELGNLRRLSTLWLSDNRLNGSIPGQLGSLSNLSELLLYNNRLTGEIPLELGNLTNLRQLRLANNQLTGCIPAGLRDVGENDLTQLGLPDCSLGTAPDLVVDRPTVSESAPAAEASFTLNPTVRNQGAARSDSTTLRYYQSSDSTITTGDTEVGTDSVFWINASASGDYSISLTAPSDPGTYYYGACVDAVSDELDTTNNCSAAVTVTVGAAPAPDLVVDTPTVSESAPVAGARFTLSATVRNQGNDRSDSTTLRYYQSTDSAITANNTAVGTDSVSRLNSSASGDESISLTAPSTAGTYYYGACVDSVSNESDTANNCSDAVKLTVSAPPDPPANTRYSHDGSTVVVTWNPSAGATHYKVYYDDFFGASCRLGFGRPSFCEELAGNVVGTTYTHASPDDDTNYYWIIACNDAGCSEIDSANPASLEGGSPAPDLVVDAPTVNNSSPTAGASFTLSATVRNQGNGESASTTLRYYRSTDGTITRSDTSVGTDSVFRIDESGTSDESISLTAPDSAGAYYYGACVDAVSGESDATNNCSTGVAVNVTAATSSSARDRDGDGLIEVDNLAQLDAVRWDLDGNGISDNADYEAAFSDADIGTMCSVTSCAGYELTANLDFDTNGNGEADKGDVYWNGGGGWIPIGESNDPFVAIFEGGGRRISNLYIRRSPNVGLFGVLGSGSTVSGIGLVDTNVAASGYGAAGALAGIGHGVIEDSFADGLVAGCVDHIGGLVGLNGGNIANSRSAGNVASARRSTSSAPGLIGDFINDLIDFPLFGSGSRTCYASGGGLVGENSGTIASSHSTSVVSGFTDNFGGLAGANSGAITNSHATGNVLGKGFADVGGLVGENETEGKIITSYATGEVSGQGDNFGGLAGANSGAITDSYATGNVSGRGYAAVGGLVGGNGIEGEIITSYATGEVSGQGDNFGGLAGVNSGVIAASYATGSVSGNGFADVGGLVGDNRYTGVITAVYAEGSVSGRADRYGGLLGSNQGIVTVCFSTGEVPQSGGGLIEWNGNYGTIANCYWDTVTSDQSDSDGGDGKTTTELQSPTGYTGPYADWNVDLDGDGSSDDPWIFGSATEYPVLNLEALDIDHGSLNARAPLEPKPNAALCRAVNYSNIEEVKAQIEAGIDVNDTCQSTIFWYDGLTPLAIAKRQGGPEIEAILVEAGAVNTVSSAPDLVVNTPTVSDSSPDAGASFTLSATVRNQGDGGSSSTTLRYYRSTDGTITTSDTSVGTDSVSNLGASESSDESISLTAPDSAGAYYYGACVDAVSGESDATNNCSSAVTVTVSSAPDLVVNTPTVSDSSPDAGASFTLSATVRNQGDGGSSSTILRYYRSTDGTITTSDTSVGTDSVSNLGASESSDESISLTAPDSAGAYYYGACVDTVTGESDTGNNCSAAVTVAVAVPTAPDLTVGAPTVSDSSPTPGASFTLSVTVRNQGSAASTLALLRYYRSTDSAITSSDTRMGLDTVPRLNPSGISDQSTSLTAPDTAGTYYYGACVEGVPSESDHTNNCSAAVTVTVAVPTAPDLTVGVPTVSDSSPTPGASFTLSVTVRNQGSAASTLALLRYYRSTNATISSSDTSVGTEAVGGLSASGSSPESIGLTAPSTPGTYYYGACVDSVTGESDTGNNCSAAVTVTVSPPPPDLVVDTPTVSDSSSDAGASFTLSATVRNQGSGSSGSTTLRYYRSTDTTITSSDAQVGTDYVFGLDASESGAMDIGLTAPSTAGTYYYGACVDAVSDESDTTNNCSSAVQVTVGAAPAPDLVVDPPTVSESAAAVGASFTLSATVRNQGTGRSDSTTLRYYRSTDSTITNGDTELVTEYVFRLDASESGAEDIGLTAPSTPGTYYYGACVDSVSGESDTTNNCSVAVAVTIVAAIPDLAIETPTASDSSPHTGESFTLSVTVLNQGNVRSDFTDLRYYLSTDSTISSSDTQLARRNRPWLSPSESEVESIILKAPSSEGTYYYGACVDTVSGETDTANNCSAAVTVVVVTPTSDLVVEIPTLSNSSPPAGTSFTLTATVRNQGSEPSSSSTTLRYYRSADSTITASDTPVGTDSVGKLAASESSDESINLIAPSPVGSYYYGACVDTLSGESDASNNCSSAVTLNVVAAIPDLVADTPTVSESMPELGDSFTLSVTVRNQGNVPSGRTTLRYYRSDDSTITTADTSVSSKSVSSIDASTSSTQSMDLDTPSTLGTYYYGACVVAVLGESNTDNNCSAAVEVVVVVPSGPDLVVEMPTVSKDTLEPGESFTLSVTVRNQGSAASGSTTLRYSTSLDTEVGTSASDSLAASGSSTASITLTAPSREGSSYYKVCVDPVPGETNTDNNCSNLVWITVPDSIESELISCTITAPPDYDITIYVSLTAIRAVESVTIKGYVLNPGGGQSPVEIGRKTIRNMTAGETVNTTVTGSVSEFYFECSIKVDWD